MRERLLKFIGPEAYNINIYTFHGFCNAVIQENIKYFGGYRDLQKLSDLEEVDVYQEIIDSFPDDHILKRFKGSLYYDSGRIKNLFSTMKQENWSSEIIEDAYIKYAKEVNDDPKYKYKRKTTSKGVTYQPGDLKPHEVRKELAKYETGVAASKELIRYTKILAKKERLDYHDMILWVIAAFQKYEDLLLGYQERYQYILVDEYQDSNGSQNEILDLLASYWGKDANIFVVGDDDQSIFRFQGANMQNIEAFRIKYDPKVIVLDNNYRSSQEILDRATTLIEFNKQRLVSQVAGLTKELIESKTIDLVKVEPQYLQYYNEKHEEKAVINKILELRDQGVDLNEIAVIYRKHKNVTDIVKYLEYNNIPINLKRRVDILQEPEIKRLLNILRFLGAEYERMHRGDHLLFEILHYKYFGLSPQDVGRLSLYCSRKTDDIDDDIRWRTVLTDEEHLTKAKVSEPEKVRSVGLLLESWIGDIANVTIQTLFEKVLSQGRVIDQIMIDPNDKTWRLQVVNTLFDFIKNETAKNPSLDLVSTLKMIDKMYQADIALRLDKIFFAKEGVNLLTGHGSKGLEFEHVFIIKCYDSNWVDKNYGRYNFKLPKTLVPATEKSDIEDDRRLFYVAMTRAKSYLYISWPKTMSDEKKIEPCRFIAESMADSNLAIQDIHLSDQDLEEYTSALMMYKEGKASMLDHDLIDKVLQDYRVSVTSLNKYLRCPLAFYFENILRVPLARNSSMGFGNAVHEALEDFFKEIEHSPERNIPAKEVLLSFFEKAMNKFSSHFTLKESENLKTYGLQILGGYYDTYNASWSLPREYKVEHKISLAQYKGVPITGKLDKVVLYDNHVDVIDYKTGKPENGKKKLNGGNGDEDQGGDYWRQLVFYKMLLDGDPSISKEMKHGVMEFIEPNKQGVYKNYPREIAPFEIEIVEGQLKDSYQRIMNHEFDKGCGEENCKWCDFVNDNFSLKAEIPAYVEDEEI